MLPTGAAELQKAFYENKSFFALILASNYWNILQPSFHFDSASHTLAPQRSHYWFDRSATGTSAKSLHTRRTVHTSTPEHKATGRPRRESHIIHSGGAHLPHTTAQFTSRTQKAFLANHNKQTAGVLTKPQNRLQHLHLVIQERRALAEGLHLVHLVHLVHLLNVSICYVTNGQTEKRT